MVETESWLGAVFISRHRRSSQKMIDYQTYCDILENNLSNSARSLCMRKTLGVSARQRPWTHHGNSPSGATGTVSLFSSGLASLTTLIHQKILGKMKIKLLSERDSLQILHIYSEYVSKNLINLKWCTKESCFVLQVSFRSCSGQQRTCS